MPGGTDTPAIKAWSRRYGPDGQEKSEDWTDFALRVALRLANIRRMSDVIYPRSPRETMAGWVHLPRFIDKIRLKRAGKLPSDYQENFTKGFDGMWLKAAGVTADDFIRMVESSITDGEVCDWVSRNVKKAAAEIAVFNSFVLNR